MLRQLPTRQRVRKSLVILAFLTFPITMNFLSPYVVIDAAGQGIVNGSLILFGLMFVASLFLGRAWCGWVCPGGGMQEIVESVNNRPVKPGKIDWVKWLIWVPWVSLVAWMAPFMIIGRWIRNRFGWASLRLVADASACSNCKLCTKNCPMSLDVNAMVQVEWMEHSECILCGTCVDNCSQKAIHYSFSAGKRGVKKPSASAPANS